MYRGDGPKKVGASSVNIGRSTSTKSALKSLEETYGVKYETPAPKTNQKSVVKTSAMTTITYKDRGDMDYHDAMQSYRPNYNKYLITAGDHFHDGASTRRKAVSFNSERQSTLDHSHAEVMSKQEQYFKQTEVASSTRGSHVNTKPKTARARRSAGDEIRYQNTTTTQEPPPVTIKREETFTESEMTKKNRTELRAHHHHHHHHPTSGAKQAGNGGITVRSSGGVGGSECNRPIEIVGDDKDDDTEEFISLIKRAVEKSVVSSMNVVLNNTFTDMSKKIERQALEIKKLSTLLQKLHNGLNSKIAHYGEENSRHFRYLCMKSEYDKMFYQHHNQLVSKPASTTPTTPRVKEPLPPHVTQRSTINTGKCSLQSTRTLVPDPSLKQPLDENMRDMVAQLKRFCLQYESSVILEEDLNKSNTSGSSGLRMENTFQSRARAMFQDDDTNISSDGMTPRSLENVNRIEVKRSKMSLATEAMNSMNEDSLCCGDAKDLYQ